MTLRKRIRSSTNIISISMRLSFRHVWLQGFDHCCRIFLCDWIINNLTHHNNPKILRLDSERESFASSPWSYEFFSQFHSPFTFLIPYELFQFTVHWRARWSADERKKEIVFVRRWFGFRAELMDFILKTSSQRMLKILKMRKTKL